MKKLLPIFTLIFLATQLAMAQQVSDSKIFAKIYGSYGIPLASSYRPSSYTTTMQGGNFSYKSIKTGLGKGVKAGIGIGMIVNDFINLGIDIEKYWGRNIKSNAFIYQVNNSKDIYISSTDIDFKADMISIMPNITFKAISQPAFFIYNRLGLRAGIINKLEEVHVVTVNNRYVEGGQTAMKDHISAETLEYKYEGGLPVGFMASLGFQTRMSDKIRFFAEIEFSHTVYNPKKRRITRWTDTAGNDRPLDTFDKSMLEIDYVKSYEVKEGVEEFDQPRKETTLRIPYSSIDLAIGFIYKL
jgi:hypothetical protein